MIIPGRDVLRAALRLRGFEWARRAAGKACPASAPRAAISARSADPYRESASAPTRQTRRHTRRGEHRYMSNDDAARRVVDGASRKRSVPDACQFEPRGPLARTDRRSASCGLIPCRALAEGFTLPPMQVRVTPELARKLSDVSPQVPVARPDELVAAALTGYVEKLVALRGDARPSL